MELVTNLQGKSKIKYMPAGQRIEYKLVHARPELGDKGWQCEKAKLIPPWGTTMLLRDVISDTPGEKVVTPKIITWAIEARKKRQEERLKQAPWMGRGAQKRKSYWGGR